MQRVCYPNPNVQTHVKYSWNFSFHRVTESLIMFCFKWDVVTFTHIFIQNIFIQKQQIPMRNKSSKFTNQWQTLMLKPKKGIFLTSNAEKQHHGTQGMHIQSWCETSLNRPSTDLTSFSTFQQSHVHRKEHSWRSMNRVNVTEGQGPAGFTSSVCVLILRCAYCGLWSVLSLSSCFQLLVSASSALPVLSNSNIWYFRFYLMKKWNWEAFHKVE